MSAPNKYEIQNRDELLSDLARSLAPYGDTKLDLLEVTLFCGGEPVLKAGVRTVLEYLADDIYWNEDSNWSEADSLKTEVL